MFRYFLVDILLAVTLSVEDNAGLKTRHKQ